MSTRNQNLGYYDAALDDVREHLTAPSDQVEPVNWNNVATLLDEAEVYPVSPGVVEKLGNLASNLKRTDKEVLSSDGTVSQVHSYVYKSGDKDSKPERIDTKTGDRLDKYQPLEGPVEPTPDYTTLIRSVPGLYEKIDTWMQVDSTKNARLALEAKILRREAMRAIQEASSNGLVRLRIADNLPVVLDEWKDNYNKRLVSNRVAKDEFIRSQKIQEQRREYGFDEFLADSNYDDKQKDTVRNRFIIVRQLGLIKGNYQTVGNNNYLALFDSLAGEEGWKHFVKTAGNKFSEYLDSTNGNINSDEVLRKRYLTILKLEGGRGINVSDNDRIATKLDVDANWENYLDRLYGDFADHMSDYENNEKLNDQLTKIFKSSSPTVVDQLKRRYCDKVSDLYATAIEDGTIVEMDTSSHDSTALALMQKDTVTEEDMFLTGDTSPEQNMAPSRRDRRRFNRKIKRQSAKIFAHHQDDHKSYAKKMHKELKKFRQDR